MPISGLFRKTHCCAVKPEIRKRLCHRSPILTLAGAVTLLMSRIRLCSQYSWPARKLCLVTWSHLLLTTYNACAIFEAYEVKRSTPATYHSWTVIEGSTGIYFGMVLVWSREVFCLYTVIKHLWFACFSPTHSEWNEIDTTKDMTEQHLLFLQP